MQIESLGHVVSKSLYFRDPDENLVEIYINGTNAWRQDPTLILSESSALDLSGPESQDAQPRALGPHDLT